MPGPRSLEYETIRFALARPWHSDSLGGGLDARFEKATEQAHRSRLRRFLLVLMIVNTCCLALDPDADVFRQALIVRLGLDLPVGVLCFWLLSSKRPAIVEAIACIAPVASVVFTTVFLSRLASQRVQSEHYLFAAAVVMSVANLRLPLRVRHAAAMAFINLTLYLFVAALPLDHARATPWDFFFFTSLLVVASLFAVYFSERANKDAFLFRLRDTLQAEDLQKACDDLSKLSYSDSLTEIANRRRFDEALSLSWEDACRTSQTLSMLMIDVDFFKKLNDSAGHSQGDACLKAIAQAIMANIRPDVDLGARYGGEEFLVLMPGRQGDEAQVIAEKIRLAVFHLRISNPGLDPLSYVTVSVGVVTCVPAMESGGSSSLLKAADAAMYRAKQGGRNLVWSASGCVHDRCAAA